MGLTPNFVHKITRPKGPPYPLTIALI
jgi:hypothetical protein